jgi:hypothetical protein
MKKRIIFFMISAVFFSLAVVLSCLAADDVSVQLKDGRAVKGELLGESLDYIVVYEPDTLWRVGLWKNMIASITINGVTYTPVKPGEMIRPSASASKSKDVSDTPVSSPPARKGVIVIKESSTEQPAAAK